MSAPTVVNTSSGPVELWRPACTVLGLVYAATGLQGIIDPLKGARMFGLVKVNETDTKFYPAVAGRNLSLGIAISAFVATGQRRALGTLLAAFTVMTVGDTCFVCNEPGVSGQLVTCHVVQAAAFALGGSWLLGFW